MCRECVFEDTPEREGGIVCEDGAWLVNLRVCAACKRRGGVRNVRRTASEDDDGSERAEFDHVCEFCGHTVARHRYSCTVDAAQGLHVYEMRCMLCGQSEDERSIDPVDPRLAPQ